MGGGIGEDRLLIGGGLILIKIYDDIRRPVPLLLQWHGGRYSFVEAGWSQVVVMQPFEIIKVRLQTQSKEAPQYRGIVDCLTKIVKEEGPLALYKGTAR